jgi:nicotinate dehydrogenase medium molybdopterin subunit
MIKHGIGYSCSFQGVNYHFGHTDKSKVDLSIEDDCSLLIRTAASDIGQGLEAMLISVASNAFNGFPIEKIRWEGSNTNSPEAGGTGASRQSTLTGNALLQACFNLQDLLRSVASEQLNASPKEIEFFGELISVNGKSTYLSDVVQEARMMGYSLKVTGEFEAPLTTPVNKGKPINQFGYATHMVEVEVDTITGEVRVLKVEAFHDAGTILNKIGATGQVEGAIVMGLGFALSEEYILENGLPINVGFTNYIIPSISDAPEIYVSFIDIPSPIGKLGVKGWAEIATATIVPAIINAIFDATGARVTHLPAVPERVLAAINLEKETK